MATEEGGTAPPPSPREGEAKATKGPTKESGGALRLQQIFEKYGGTGPAIPPKLAAFLGPRSHGDRSRSKQSRLRHVECPPQTENAGSALKPEILETLMCEVPGAVLTPYGVGVRESQEDEQGFVHVKFAWGTALVAAKDISESRSAVLRWQLDSLGSLFALLVSDLGHRSDSDSDSDSIDSGNPELERPQGLASVKALLAWLEQAALEPKASHQQALLDLALLLSGLVSGRAELLRLEGISSSSQLQAELMAADALRIHLGLLERLGRSSEQRHSLADSCRSWCQVLEQVGAEQLVGGAWRLVRPGAKQADPLSEEELLSSMPTARRSSFVLHMPTRLSSRPEITSVKVTAGPVFVGPPRTTVLHHPNVIQQSASPLTRAQRPPAATISPFGVPRQLSGTPAVAYSGDATCSLSRTKARSLYVAPLQNRTGEDTPKADTKADTKASPEADKACTASPVRRVKSEKAPVKAWR